MDDLLKDIEDGRALLNVLDYYDAEDTSDFTDPLERLEYFRNRSLEKFGVFISWTPKELLNCLTPGVMKKVILTSLCELFDAVTSPKDIHVNNNVMIDPIGVKDESTPGENLDDTNSKPNTRSLENNESAFQDSDSLRAAVAENELSTSSNQIIADDVEPDVQDDNSPLSDLTDDVLNPTLRPSNSTKEQKNSEISIDFVYKYSHESSNPETSPSGLVSSSAVDACNAVDLVSKDFSSCQMKRQTEEDTVNDTDTHKEIANSNPTQLEIEDEHATSSKSARQSQEDALYETDPCDETASSNPTQLEIEDEHATSSKSARQIQEDAPNETNPCNETANSKPTYLETEDEGEDFSFFETARQTEEDILDDSHSCDETGNRNPMLFEMNNPYIEDVKKFEENQSNFKEDPISVETPYLVHNTDKKDTALDSASSDSRVSPLRFNLENLSETKNTKKAVRVDRSPLKPVLATTASEDSLYEGIIDDYLALEAMHANRKFKASKKTK